MTVRVRTAVPDGQKARLVTIEAVELGPSCAGRPAAAPGVSTETLGRVRDAVTSSGYRWPYGLEARTDPPHAGIGPHAGLALAIAFLAADGSVPAPRPGMLLLGGVTRDGGTEPVPVPVSRLGPQDGVTEAIAASPAPAGTAAGTLPVTRALSLREAAFWLHDREGTELPASGLAGRAPLQAPPRPGGRAALAVLTALVGAGDTRLAGLARQLGPEETLAAIRAGAYPGRASSDRERQRARQALDRWRARLDGLPDPARLLDAGAGGPRLICPGDREWPGQLADLGADAPLALWAQGPRDLHLACSSSLTVAGSRDPGAYGSHVASDLACGAAERGQTIVADPGGGTGKAAHSGAAAAGASAVAVLAGSLDVLTGTGHGWLLDALAEEGVIVSAQPPGCQARACPGQQARILAALSQGTLIVEAGERSAALGVAGHARALGRTLMAVPGPVTTGRSRGSHRILRDWNGTLITGPSDIVAALEKPRTAAEPPGPGQGAAPAPDAAAARAGEHGPDGTRAARPRRARPAPPHGKGPS